MSTKPIYACKLYVHNFVNSLTTLLMKITESSFKFYDSEASPASLTLTLLRKKSSSPVTGDEDKYEASIKKTTSTLTIATAALENAGVYKCTADFGGTTVESDDATVRIYGEEGYLTGYLHKQLR